MNKICSDDFKKAKKIEMRCPYCGKWHELRYNFALDGFSLTCARRFDSNHLMMSTPKYVTITINEELQELNICMNHPCIFLNFEDEKVNLKIPFSEFKREKERIRITKIVKLKDMDKVIEEGEYNSFMKIQLIEKIGDGCQNGKGECSECLYTQSVCKLLEDMFVMKIEVEIVCFLEKEKGNVTEEPEAEIEDATGEPETESEEETEEPETKSENVTEEFKAKGEKSMMMLVMNDINKLSKDFGIDFGVNTDERIQSTILGTVVEYSTGKFRGFDRKTKQMTEYSNLATISLPSILVPSTTVKEGDTIIHSGEPLFIVKAEEDDVWGANPITSKEEKVLPISNPLGIKTYTRLISVGELLGFKGGNNPQNTRIAMWILTMLAQKVFSEGVDSANDKIRETTAKGEKYLEVLAPFACVAFTAYAMKGDDMKSDSIIQTAKDTLGVDLDCLKDKKNLKRIAAIGVATTAAISYFNGKVKKAALDEGAEHDEEEVTNGLDKLIKAIKPWESTIKKVLPAAIAICAVAIFNDKKIGNIKEQLEGCVLLVQDRVCEKLGIDEDFFNEENLKKLVALIGIAVAIFIAYGKKLDGKDKNAEEAKGMIKQIIPVILPLAPAVIVFAPKLKTFFKKYGYEDIKEEDCADFWDCKEGWDENNDFAEVDAEEVPKENAEATKESETVEDSEEAETPEN